MAQLKPYVRPAGVSKEPDTSAGPVVDHSTIRPPGVAIVRHLPDPLGLRAIRMMAAAPCSVCDRASAALGRSGQNLCNEHARIHYGIPRRRKRAGRIGRNSPAELAALTRWRT